VLDRVEKIKEMMSKLRDLEDAQMEASLLLMITCMRLCQILSAVLYLTGHG